MHDIDSESSQPSQLLSSNQIDPASVFPQCLDNVFVPFDVFDKLSSGRGLTYKSNEIRSERGDIVDEEFKRSLVYAPHVIVNRAYYPNNEYLYRYFLPSFSDKARNPHYQIDEWAELQCGSGPDNYPAIIPYLFHGSDFWKDFKFTTDDDGMKACKHLFDTCGNKFLFMRLADTQEQLKKVNEEISANFEQGLVRLGQVMAGEEMYSSMCGALFSSRYAENLGATKSFKRRLFELYRFSQNRCNKRVIASLDDKSPVSPVQREEIYRRFFINCTCTPEQIENKKCRCITDGKYRTFSTEEERRFTFGLKCLTDLVYGTNVPDKVFRFFMTPMGMPTRDAIPMSSPVQSAMFGTLDELARETLGVFERALAFYSATSKAMYLPLLKDLTLRDVLVIRDKPEWRQFIDLQRLILSDPVKNISRLEEFQAAFEALQNEISKYYVDKYIKEKNLPKYVGYVSSAFEVTGLSLRVGVRAYAEAKQYHLTPSGTLLIDEIIRRVFKAASDHIAVGPARIFFDIFDADTRKVDRHRSWSIDLMRKQVAWEKKELLEYLHNVRGKLVGSEMVPSSGLADIAGQ